VGGVAREGGGAIPPTDPVSDADAASLTFLDCSAQPITSLSGMEGFTGLTILGLNTNQTQ
jgi:Leucine-rich repeat (LRR) protein